jgi:DNA-binding GntR family transcriptional regulator
MLRSLLQLVARGEAVRSAELASALGVSTALVDSMLEVLAQRGYLRLVAAGCTACARCPARAACLYGNAARVWVLTERARVSSGSVRAAEPGLT